MTVEEKILAILSAAGSVTALVPTERIKPEGDWQNLARPYIVHQPIVGQPIHTHGEGLVSLRIWDFYEVSIYAASTSEARAIGEAVTAALDGHVDSEVNRIALANTPRISPYDTDRKVASVTLDFQVAGALT